MIISDNISKCNQKSPIHPTLRPGKIGRFSRHDYYLGRSPKDQKVEFIQRAEDNTKKNNAS